jgi:hypothetical protein
MLVDELRRAVEASPRAELHTMSGLLWRAFAAGQVSEAEASALSDLIEAKRAMPAPPPRPRLRVGSRPRTPESLARRRRWAASGALPPALASRFTLAEQAVLAVVAAEHQAHGRCALTIGHIAALILKDWLGDTNHLADVARRHLLAIGDRLKGRLPDRLRGGRGGKLVESAYGGAQIRHRDGFASEFSACAAASALGQDAREHGDAGQPSTRAGTWRHGKNRRTKRQRAGF